MSSFLRSDPALLFQIHPEELLRLMKLKLKVEGTLPRPFISSQCMIGLKDLRIKRRPPGGREVLCHVIKDGGGKEGKN